MSTEKNWNYKITAYRQGMQMGSEHCYDWLEADIKAEDMLKCGLYDEIRIVKIVKDDEDAKLVR